jgi:uncharacterized protein (TIGR03435 family)
MSPKYVAAILLIGAVSLLSQPESAQTLAFEAASIKVHPWQREPRDPATVSGRLVISGSRVTVTAKTLSGLVNYAYDTSVSGGPEWAKSQFYDITAKAEDSLTDDQSRLLFQRLLADRFRLKVHRMPQGVQTYELVIAKGGPKLKESPTGSVYQLNETKARTISVIRGTAMTTTQLADRLSQYAGRPVRDQTTLKGQYDLKLQWTRDTMAPNPAGLNPALSAFPPLSTALQEQLGLKMEATNGTRYVIVIDRAEQPTEN